MALATALPNPTTPVATLVPTEQRLGDDDCLVEQVHQPGAERSGEPDPER
ncbi:MAG: hypothetical protein ACR2JQ_10890 [Mycobacteriales bacterium]